MIFLIKGNQELFHACIQQLSDEQKEALSNALSNGWPSTNISCYPRLQNFIVVCGKTWRVCVIQLGWSASLFNIAEDQGFHKTFRIQSYKLTLCNCYGCCACVRMREGEREKEERERETHEYCVSLGKPKVGLSASNGVQTGQTRNFNRFQNPFVYK